MVDAEDAARGGDRRFTTVSVLLLLSLAGNLLLGMSLENTNLPPTMVKPEADLTILLLQEQVKRLGSQVAQLTTALTVETDKALRAETTAGLRETHIAALQTVIEANATPHAAELREREMRARSLVLRASTRIGGRVAEAVQRSVAAMVGEAVPAFGLPVIVTTTALEVRDACSNLQDVFELNAAFAPELTTDENRDHVCGITVPTVDELKQGALSRLKIVGKTIQDTLPEWAGGDAAVKAD